jgi:hypothetical protein
MGKCLNCKKDLVQTAGKREKIFCNSTCRSNYWQKTQTLERQGKSVDTVAKIMTTRPETVKISSGNDAQIAKYQKELAGLGTSGLAILRKKFLLKQIQFLERKP